MSSKKLRQRSRTTERLSRVFSYVVAHDLGFAPNPFHGWCSLACCKPRIRGSAAPGDLVLGLTSRSKRVVYMMRISERLTFEEYWVDPRFRAKRPNWKSARGKMRWGDNIYQPDGAGGFVQHRSCHWDHETDQESLTAKSRDTGQDAVLVSRDFVYFGAAGPPLPKMLEFLAVSRGHRCRYSSEQVTAVHEYFDTLERGVLGSPATWSSDDNSWRSSCS